MLVQLYWKTCFVFTYHDIRQECNLQTSKKPQIMKLILLLNCLIAQVLSFGPDVNLDFLTFVQDWPIADCIEYLHYDPTVQCSIKSTTLLFNNSIFLHFLY